MPTASEVAAAVPRGGAPEAHFSMPCGCTVSVVNAIDSAARHRGGYL